jgi:hypothetical protein
MVKSGYHPGFGIKCELLGVNPNFADASGVNLEQLAENVPVYMGTMNSFTHSKLQNTNGLFFPGIYWKRSASICGNNQKPIVSDLGTLNLKGINFYLASTPKYRDCSTTSTLVANGLDSSIGYDIRYAATNVLHEAKICGEYNIATFAPLLLPVFGDGLKWVTQEQYKEIIAKSAKGLSKHFDEPAKIIADTEYPFAITLRALPKIKRLSEANNDEWTSGYRSAHFSQGKMHGLGLLHYFSNPGNYNIAGLPLDFEDTSPVCIDPFKALDYFEVEVNDLHRRAPETIKFNESLSLYRAGFKIGRDLAKTGLVEKYYGNNDSIVA